MVRIFRDWLETLRNIDAHFADFIAANFRTTFLNIFRTEKLHEQRTVNRKLRLFYQHQLATESNNRNAVEEEIKSLRKNLEIEKSKQISTLLDSEITKTLEEHYKEKLDKLAQENEQLKKRYESYRMSHNLLTNIYQFICRWEEAEKNKEVETRESVPKISETNSVTFQVNDIPEWGTLDKNLDQVQAIDQWFQGRFLLFLFSSQLIISTYLDWILSKISWDNEEKVIEREFRGIFLNFSSMDQSKDELKYFFSLVAEDVASKSVSKNLLYTTYQSSSTPNQTYDKIFTKLAHLSKGKVKNSELGES